MLDLRKVCRLAGLGLATMGIVFAAGATYSHLAWALPLRELPARPALVTGVLVLAAGGLLVRVAGWSVWATQEPG